MKISAYEVGVRGTEWTRTINAKSRGAAKAEYLRDVRDAWSEVKFTDITCRSVGSPQSSERFLSNAKYRGMPDLRCGDRVRVGKSLGTITGHDCSANFEVLFDEDSEYRGAKLSVHPQELEPQKPTVIGGDL